MLIQKLDCRRDLAELHLSLSLQKQTTNFSGLWLSVWQEVLARDPSLVICIRFWMLNEWRIDNGCDITAYPAKMGLNLIHNIIEFQPFYLFQR